MLNDDVDMHFWNNNISKSRRNSINVNKIVHGKLKNLALGKGTSQSSTEYGGNSERAVDGNISGEFSQNSVTHTSYQEQSSDRYA